MKVHKKYIWTGAFFVLLLICGISIFLLGRVLDVPGDSVTHQPKKIILNQESMSLSSSMDANQILNDKFLNIGEAAGKWTVSKISQQNNKFSISLENISAEFKGKVQITGRYYNVYSDMLDAVYFYPSKVSKKNLPKVEGIFYDKPFILRNKQFAEKVFQKKGSYGEATIVISEYALIRYPGEFNDSAILINMVQSTQEGLLEYPKSLDVIYDHDLWSEYQSNYSKLEKYYLIFGY